MNLANIQPGAVLAEEFLQPLGISTSRFADEIGLPEDYLTEILLGRSRIEEDLADRFGKYFGTSPAFWSGLQKDFDLDERKNHAAE